jgi:hypothetical protein
MTLENIGVNRKLIFNLDVILKDDSAGSAKVSFRILFPILYRGELPWSAEGSNTAASLPKGPDRFSS